MEWVKLFSAFGLIRYSIVCLIILLKDFSLEVLSFTYSLTTRGARPINNNSNYSWFRKHKKYTKWISCERKNYTYSCCKVVRNYRTRPLKVLVSRPWQNLPKSYCYYPVRPFGNNYLVGWWTLPVFHAYSSSQIAMIFDTRSVGQINVIDSFQMWYAKQGK